jgi:hypothetical protein
MRNENSSTRMVDGTCAVSIGEDILGAPGRRPLSSQGDQVVMSIIAMQTCITITGWRQGTLQRQLRQQQQPAAGGCELNNKQVCPN